MALLVSKVVLSFQCAKQERIMEGLPSRSDPSNIFGISLEVDSLMLRLNLAVGGWRVEGSCRGDVRC